MNSLHLFAGIGGGILADKILGNTIVGAVEIEPYCRAVLKQRQEEGYLEPFPIFEDIRNFKGDEIGRQIDLVCGGFPCQDISTAGKGAGINGEKSSLFYELIRVCRTIRPRYIFLENSPAIVGRGLGLVLKEIAESGYNAEWTDLSAGICGAPHLRNRWWCLCKMSDSDCNRELQPQRIVENLRRRFSNLGSENFGTVQRRSGETWTETQRSRRDTETDREREIRDAKSMGRGQGLFAGDVDEPTEKRKSGPCRTSDDNGDGGRVAAQRTSSRIGNDSLSGGARNTADADCERLRRPSDRTADETQRTWTEDSRSNDGTLEESQRLSGNQKEDGARQIPYAESLGRRPFNETDGSCESTEAPFSLAIGGSAGIGTGEILDSDAMGREQSGREPCQSTEASFPWAIGGSADGGTGWWEIEPDVGRVANGVPHRVDRLKGLGNAQVPVVAALAFLLLMERFCE